VREEHRVELRIQDAVRSRLLQECTRDMANGGRGIGNRLESAFINPLSRALFLFSLNGRETLQVSEIAVDPDGIASVTLQ
jgi:ATP-dependent Clp protease ATP-binding subunit ClpA